MLVLRTLLFLLGLALVALTLGSAIKTFVLPRGARDVIVRLWFRLLLWLFYLRMKWTSTYVERDRIMALYAPVALVLLLPIWLTFVTIGFMAMYQAISVDSSLEDFVLSGSSLLTLGFARGHTAVHDLLAFAEATIGLILVALLIAYLPTMYGAFARREMAVSQLAVRAGTPPSASEFIRRAHRIGALGNLRDFWIQWENWFSDVEESHSSLAALVFFRSPEPAHSWITAAGTVLDSAALIAAVVDLPREPQAELCIRAGYLALWRVADYFSLPFIRQPLYPAEPISVTRAEFDALCCELKEKGVPLYADLDQAWLDFAGWRVNYDKALLGLCTLTMAPIAPWSSDRAPAYRPLPIFKHLI
ncbi:MAG: hypothetical protein R3C14_43860 [Caldilineaceae bacterium]